MNTTPPTRPGWSRRAWMAGALAMAVLTTVIAGCGDDGDNAGIDISATAECDAEPVILATDDGVEFVRTPDSCFENLPDFPYEPNYVEIDGLRQAYVDEGPTDGEVVLLLHGQPSWSYLYRDMIPVFADAGYRVVAMDHLGMGRSDKPIDIDDYSYVGHAERLEQFIAELGLTDINLFVQDWGSLIGLKVAGENPELFATITVGDGNLIPVPEGVELFPAVENPDELADIQSPFAAIPAQQVPFYDGCDPILGPGADNSYFGDWMAYAMTAESFHASEVVEAMTWYDLSPEEEAAYDAPFPSRTYMAGPRVFPSLSNQLGGNTAEGWAGLTNYDKPFLTLWASNDPGQLGSCAAQQRLIDSVPGAQGQPHDRLPEASHFLQDDQGTEIATRMVGWYDSLGGQATAASSEPVETPVESELLPGRYCEILLVEPADGGFQAEVWGTQLLNDCPPAALEALDPEVIKTETGAFAVAMNGPRAAVMDATTGDIFTSLERRMFGDLEMRLLTTVVIDGESAGAPYTEGTVLRETTFTYDAGRDIHVLVSPEGDEYVMQALSQIVDPTLGPDDLATLGSRLDLPDGWTYQVRTLTGDLVLVAEGDAIVLQDDLRNSYQRRSAADMGWPEA